MSAVAGYWSLRRGPHAPECCRRLLDALSDYGVDSLGLWADGPIAIGRRLTRSLPEDIYDEQPLVSKQTGRVLVADVRLDNRQEIIEALDITPECARTMSDA